MEKIIRNIHKTRLCLMGIAVPVALLDALIGSFFTMPYFEYGYFSIFLLVPILALLTTERYLQKENDTILFRLWCLVTMVAVAHAFLAMVIRLFQDPGSCYQAGLLSICWYWIPWMVLTLLIRRSSPPSPAKIWDMAVLLIMLVIAVIWMLVICFQESHLFLRLELCGVMEVASLFGYLLWMAGMGMMRLVQMIR